MIVVEDQTTDDPVKVDKATALFDRIRGFAQSVEASRGIIQEALQRCESRQ